MRGSGLLHLDRTGGAFACARAAGDACISVHCRLAIDFDRANGAGTFAHAATDADILIHFSSHGILQDCRVGWNAARGNAVLREAKLREPGRGMVNGLNITRQSDFAAGSGKFILTPCMQDR